MAERGTHSTFSILVVGETGTGKSSVINMLFDNESKSKSSGQATGCTTECAVIEGFPPGYENVLYLRVYDTVGVCESTEGTVPTGIALEKFEKLLKSLKDGIHLLLFCIRMGRLSQATKDNYKLFCDTLCDNKVPCLLVITHCESEDVLDQWWIDNRKVIEEQLRYKVIDGISVTTKKTGKHACLEEYITSRKYLLDAVAKHVSTEAWNPNTTKRKFYARWKKLWNKRGSPSKHDPFQQYLEAPRIDDEQNAKQGGNQDNQIKDGEKPGHVVPNDKDTTQLHLSSLKATEPSPVRPQQQISPTPGFSLYPNDNSYHGNFPAAYYQYQFNWGFTIL